VIRGARREQRQGCGVLETTGTEEVPSPSLGCGSVHAMPSPREAFIQLPRRQCPEPQLGPLIAEMKCCDLGHGEGSVAMRSIGL
jgi:hypothetical protein